MAVTIIEKGDINKAPTYIRTCPECGTVFSYQYVDTQYDNFLGGYKSIDCPVCKYPVAHLTAGGGADINHPALKD